MTDLYSGMAKNIAGLAVYGEYSQVDELMADYDPKYFYPPQYEREFSTSRLNSAKRFLEMILDWKETQ